MKSCIIEPTKELKDLDMSLIPILSPKFSVLKFHRNVWKKLGNEARSSDAMQNAVFVR